MIETGVYPPGTRLPSERALAAQFNVGRPLLREVLKSLTAMGVLETRDRSGTFVRANPPAVLHETPKAAVPQAGAIEVLEARTIIEPRAAWLAATRATEQDLLDIEAARQELEDHESDWRLVAKLDYELHAAIVRAARNPALDLMHHALASQALASRQLTARFSPDLVRMRADHKAIVEAILLRQADAAEKAMIHHLQSVGLDFISEAAR
jgi:DNA-binding FadR family transcriptional regulator